MDSGQWIMDNEMRIASITLLLIALCSLSASARAGTFPLTGTTSLSYSDPSGGSITPDAGNPVSTNPSSSLAGYGVSYSDNYNQPFVAASITYANGSSAGIPNQVTMQIGTDYTTGAGGKGTAGFNFGLDLSATGNSSVVLSVATQYSTGAYVSSDGSTTYMQFLGFGDSTISSLGLAQTLTANLSSSATAYLWVEYVVVEPESQNPLPGGGGGTPSVPLSPSAPEPSAWLLGLMGFGLVGVLALIQNSKSQTPNHKQFLNSNEYKNLNFGS